MRALLTSGEVGRRARRLCYNPAMREAGNVALVNMPWAPADRPSIQLGILTATLDQAAIASDSHFFNLDFLDLLRQQELASLYSAALPALLGEWMFAVALDPGLAAVPPSPLAQQAVVAYAAACSVEPAQLTRLRLELAPAFVDQLIERVDWSRLAAACFTLTYPQIAAAFALARRLKARWPRLQTIFGGAASQIHAASSAAYLRTFDFIDVMVVGEAEPVLAQVVEVALAGGPWPALPGVHPRAGQGAPTDRGFARAARADALPIPDYRPFAAARERLPPESQQLVRTEVPIEFARGCPWATKTPCAFCGFYPTGGYRPKRAQRVLDELATQRARLGWSTFCVVDSTVTRHQVDHVFARVAAGGADIAFSFVEVRSDLPRRQLEKLRAAGVQLVQPGVEALDDGLLRRLNKGVTLFDNIRLLKWCRELDLEVSYNLLLGIPQATADELNAQLVLLPRLMHLAPPYAAQLNLVRGSRYWCQSQSFGFGSPKPHALYAEIFPPALELPQVAYEFSADRDLSATRALYDATGRQIRRWQRWWQGSVRPSLTLRQEGERVVVDDRRNPNRPSRSVDVDRRSGAIYRSILDRPRSAREIAVALRWSRQPASVREVEERLAELVDRELVLALGGRHLALATRCTIIR